MSVWFTSDLHIGHAKVAGIRGFFDEDNVIGGLPDPISGEEYAEAAPDIDEHDAAMAEMWDSLVRPDDTVIVLGDISASGSQRALNWIWNRPGSKHLIAGNHDPVGPWNRDAWKKQEHWLQYFDSILPYARRRLNGKQFLLSHFPYWPGDRGEPRYEQYRLPNLGLPLLHGHTHSQEKFEFPNSLHVGWDAWRRPVHQDEVQDWLETVATQPDA